MSRNVLVESRGLMQKFARLEASAKANVTAVVKEATRETHAEVVRFLSVPVAVGRRGQRIRSRPGQSPRTETGRLKRSVVWKTSPKGWVGYVTTDNTAQDKKGRRYPWMLEAGTRRVKKRPTFRKVQRRLVRKYRQRIGAAMVAAVREASR